MTSEVLAAPGRLKESGNKKYASGEIAAAVDEYTKSIELLDSLSLHGELGGGEEHRKKADLLRATVLTNRAMARYKNGEFEAGELDCSEALELDPGRIKALFKRAQCRERLNKNGDGLRDASRLCRMDPNNKEVVALAVLLRDKISKAAETDSVLSRTLKDVNDGESDVVERAIKLLLSLSAEDHTPISIALMKETGIMNTIFSLCSQGNVPALRLMGSCFQHRPFGESIVTAAASGATPIDQMVDQIVLNLREFSTLVAQGGGGSVEPVNVDLSVACIFFVLQLVHHDEILLRQLPEDSEATNVKMALDRLVPSVATIFASAISSPSAIIRDAGMEAIAQWCPLRNIDDMNDDDIENRKQKTKTIDPVSRGKERASRFRLNDKRRLAASERGLCIARLVTKSLNALLSSTENGGNEKRKAGATLTLIVKAAKGAETVKSIDNEETMNALHVMFEPFMKFGESNDDDAIVASSSRLSSVIRRIGLATALAGADMGQWVMSKEHCIEEIMVLSAAGDEMASEVAAEAICACASFDGGRALLGPVIQTGVIFSLMDSPSPIARSAAASAYTKLGMVSQALKGDSADISTLLNVSLDIISKGGGDGQKLEEDRAIEVLTILVAKTKVKEELVHGSGRCVASLHRLCEIATQLGGPGPVAFGLSTVFKSITISHEEEVKESLKGKDISYDQYEQLKKLATTHGQESKEDILDADTEEATRIRCVKLVEAGGVAALKRLCSVAREATTGGPTLIATCKAFRHIATEPETRGYIVSQGGLSCLEKVSDSSSNKEACMEARHATAKTMVSTNPNMIPEESLLGAISSLMELVSDNDSSNLQQFEALLSLTNIASTGEPAQKRIAKKKGIHSIHYHMFSDNKLVRRAATECLPNLLPCKEVVELMALENNARLWVAFAGLEEEDVGTALAACGAIAMASYFKEAAMAFIEADALDTLKEVRRWTEE